MSEKVKDMNLFGLVICFFLGHKSVDGSFSDGKFIWAKKCSRCNALGGKPQIETGKAFNHDLKLN